MKTHPRVCLIHAVAVAMQPIDDAFVQLWPAVVRVNLLDDSLSVDRARQTELSSAIHKRIGDLADYALSGGADAILFTCSAFGPAIDAVAARAAVPVLKPNDAMFEAALAHGRDIGMVATFEPSVASMAVEFRDLADRRGSTAQLRAVCVGEAMTALKAGDAARHHALVAEAAWSLRACDAIMLAQFSTARAAPTVATRLKAPVLTSPGAAVLKLKSLISRM